ncbi:MAG: 1-acyl-sn-glycerol-3-phosphate acyltransferase [Acidobacteriota bacterium]
MRKEDQSRVLSEVRKRVVDVAATSDDVSGIVQRSIDAESKRLDKEPLSLRSLSDRGFWFGLQLRLRWGGEAAARDALWAIVSNYAEEVCGDFDPVAYEVALRLLPPALRVLLSSSQISELPDKLLQDRHDRIVLDGHTQEVQRLHEANTLVFAPTHHSNLDSIVLGLALNRLGVPPLIYGAGINLLGNPVMSLFMHNFGAYTVDRRKTDPLYRDVLKEYVVVTLEQGYHHLFFPGGTRSRSGELESQLKLGLLGSSARARLNLLAEESARRVLVVPVILSYELVPEAESLVGTEAENSSRFAEFAQRLLALDSQIHVVFGEPIDVDGSVPGQLPADDLVRLLSEAPRKATASLGTALVNAYQRYNYVQPTNIVAFALRSELADGERAAARDALEHRLEGLLYRLRDLERRGALRIPEAPDDAHGLLLAADTAFASYHHRRAVAVEAATVHTESPELLEYYANRLNGYGLA